MKYTPFISVILPVFNGAPYLRASIESILSQTYGNFELIIINDGSTDNSDKIIESFDDSRIRYYYHKNQGLPATLNFGIERAGGEIIARHDQDDISLPLRFERQVEFLLDNANCGMVGTWAEIRTDDKSSNRIHQHPSDNASLQFFLLFDNPFVHSSVMIRREVFDKVGFYSIDCLRQPPEDYEFWSRVARNFEVANLPEVHLIYREIPTSMSRTGVNPFLEKVVNISAENLVWESRRGDEYKLARDLAALVHGAFYQVSPEARFKIISHLFFVVIENVRQRLNLDTSFAQELVDLRLRTIRYNYLICRFGGPLGKLIAVFDSIRSLKR